MVLAAASLGPTMYLVISAVRSESVESSVIAMIIVNLTRILLILNSLSALVYRILDWSSMRARLDVLFSVKASIAEGNDLARRPSGQIFLNGQPVQDALEIARIVTDTGHGRFTLTGANGSGKSTTLLGLKKIFGEAGSFFPHITVR